MMNPFSWLQMTNMISYQGLVRTFLSVTEDYIKYINEDFEGKNSSQIEEPYFVLQQRILDRLLLALQKEISSKS